MAQNESTDKAGAECIKPDVLDPSGMHVQAEACRGSLLHEVVDSFARKTVTLNTERESGSGSGSGFFVHDGRYVLTAAHVVNNTKTIEVTSNDGQTRQAKLVKLNDIDDLALLEVQGIKADPSRAVDIGQSSELTKGSAIVGIGTPGSEVKEFLSPGYAEAKVPMYEVIRDAGGIKAPQPGSPPSLSSGLYRAGTSSDAKVRADVDNYLLSPRIVTSATAVPGQSGGLVVGSDLKFAGMIQSNFKRVKDGSTGSAYVPDDVVRDFVAAPSKFDILYNRKSKFELAPTAVVAELATDVGAPVAGALIPKLGRAVPAAYGLFKAGSIVENYRGYTNPDNDEALKADYGRKVAEDAGYGIGGLALSVGLAASGRLRAIGLLAGGLTFGASTFSSSYHNVKPSQEVLTSIKRKDGDSRLPFLWDNHK
ncbi:MAG TPA: serine protease [Candidatus Obscuribacter sp.]|nr:serine protease [Candidatus Obscuribacter sp.]